MRSRMRCWAPGGGCPQRRDDVGAQSNDAPHVVPRRLAVRDAELACVRRLGAENMVDHLVPVAAASTRPRSS